MSSSLTITAVLLTRAQIPLVWREWQPLAQTEFNKALVKWERNERNPKDEKYGRPKLRMHPDNAQHFLKLAASLKVDLGRSVRVADLDRAERLLREYQEGFLVLCSRAFEKEM